MFQGCYGKGAFFALLGFMAMLINDRFTGLKKVPEKVISPFGMGDFRVPLDTV